jgi:thiol:disulfide interchange protein DsbD
MHTTKRMNLITLLLGLLLLLFAGSPSAQQEQDYLMPDEAYPVSAKSDGADGLLVRWKIADGYYLYRNKFKFISETPGVELGSAEFPPAKIKSDPFFGDVEVYRNQVEIRLPLKRNDGEADTLRLKTISQGCADAGLCYPPHRQNLSIELPPPSANDVTPAQSPAAALQALGNLGAQLGLSDENEILSPEEAYRFSASVEGGDRIRLQWQIADGTYLYQDKIRFKLLDPDGVTLGDYELPKPKIKKGAIRPDGTIGDLPVYVHEIDLPVPLVRSNSDATEIELLTSYQGCADVGICYPPQTQQVRLALPAMQSTAAIPALAKAQQAVVATVEPATAAPAPTAAAPAVQQSETDRITSTLVGGNTWLIILSFFGFGLLLSLTPCVFPMIPILSGIIAGQGEHITTRRAFTLSLVYVLAMSVTYTIGGVLAGLFGQNLQATFQSPWILGSFAILFVLLALSMFGFYELQLPSRWQSRLSEASNHQHGGNYTGVAVMGLLSALIVGPCVAPPLAGALIYIGKTGDALLGGIGLFSMAIGMGAPLLVLGASAGKLLPRAGIWMDSVKAVFGVGMLAVSIVLLERILPPAISMLLWGALLVTTSVYMGALRQLSIEASGWDRLWKGLGLVMLIYGALMLVGVATGGRDTVQPLRGLGFSASGEAQSGELRFKRIKSLSDLEREVTAASALGQPVMLDFYADWCVSCKEMERYTFSDPAVHRALKDFVLLQADVTANDETDQALLQEHFGLPGPPAIIFYARDGSEQRAFRVIGFMNAAEFADHVTRADR